MPGPHLTAAELAAELGVSRDWVYRNWPTECARGMPMPVRDGGNLAWNRAQFYAWLDRDLDEKTRVAAMAYRAAAAAAAGAPHTHDDTTAIERDRAALSGRLGVN